MSIPPQSCSVTSTRIRAPRARSTVAARPMSVVSKLSRTGLPSVRPPRHAGAGCPPPSRKSNAPPGRCRNTTRPSPASSERSTITSAKKAVCPATSWAFVLTHPRCGWRRPNADPATSNGAGRGRPTSRSVAEGSSWTWTSDHRIPSGATNSIRSPHPLRSTSPANVAPRACSSEIVPSRSTTWMAGRFARPRPHGRSPGGGPPSPNSSQTRPVVSRNAQFSLASRASTPRICV